MVPCVVAVTERMAGGLDAEDARGGKVDVGVKDGRGGAGSLDAAERLERLLLPLERLALEASYRVEDWELKLAFTGSRLPDVPGRFESWVLVGERPVSASKASETGEWEALMLSRERREKVVLRAS